MRETTNLSLLLGLAMGLETSHVMLLFQYARWGTIRFEEVCESCRGCELGKQSLNFFKVKKYTMGRLKFCMNL